MDSEMLNRSGIKLLAPIGLVILAFIMPYIVGSSLLGIFALLIIWTILTLSWVILYWGGLISFGQAGFFGISAFLLHLMYVNLGTGWIMGTIGGVLVCVLIGFIISRLTMELSGAFFALSMLAFHYFSYQFSLFTMGDRQIANIPQFPAFFSNSLVTRYWFLLIIAIVIIILAYKIRTSLFGLQLRSMDKDEIAAESMGVNTRRNRMYLIMISGAIAGLAGSLYTSHYGFLTSFTIFKPRFSIWIIPFALLGGAKSPFGAVLGTIILYAGDRLVLSAIFPEFHGIFFGLAAVLVMLFMPRGILGWVKDRYGIEIP